MNRRGEFTGARPWGRPRGSRKGSPCTRSLAMVLRVGCWSRTIRAEYWAWPVERGLGVGQGCRGQSSLLGVTGEDPLNAPRAVGWDQTHPFLDALREGWRLL